MRKNWMYALSLLLMPLWGHAEEEEPRSFQEVVLAVLGEQVQDLGSAYSQGVVKLIAQESGLDDAEVRSKLVELLDGLDAQRKGKTDAWKDVVAAGGKDIEAKKVDKFFKELSKELHKVVEKKGDYALESLVGKAASKARIQNYEGEDILVRLLGPEDASSSLVSVELPEKIGIVVTGESSYAIDREGFEDLLITSQDRLTFNKVRDIHVPIATGGIGHFVLLSEGAIASAPETRNQRWPPSAALRVSQAQGSTWRRPSGKVTRYCCSGSQPRL